MARKAASSLGSKVKNVAEFSKLTSRTIRAEFRSKKVPPHLLGPCIERVRSLRDALRLEFVDREEAAEAIIAALMAGVPIVLFGAPGTAKSRLIRRLAAHCGITEADTEGELNGRRRYFEYLLTQHTMPEELFGPPDIGLLGEGQFKRNVAGMLPEAEIAFLDEVFRGSSQILNTLLTIINERRFHDGAGFGEVPLLNVIGASNNPPRDPELEAFYDRFPIRVWLNSVLEGGDERHETARDLLVRSQSLDSHSARTPPQKACLNDFWMIRESLRAEAWDPAAGEDRQEFVDCFLRFRNLDGCRLSDRSLYTLSLVGRAFAKLFGDEGAIHHMLRAFRYVAQSKEAADRIRDELEASGRRGRHTGTQ